MLIGREKEIAELEEVYHSDEAELVAVYGRRRVGKTYLINEVFRDRFVFTHAGLSPVEVNDSAKITNKRMKEQLFHFYQSLVLNGLKPKKKPTSWLEAFYLLETLLIQKDDGKRQVVFLDEIQWMDTPKSGFITGLEAFWNSWACKRHNLMIIVCGSSASWILDKLINNHGGMYDRVTKQIHLKAFDLCETEKYLVSQGINYSRYDVVQTYMSLGGVPYYMKYMDRTQSYAQNMDSLFCESNSPLRNEFDRLFSSLFSNPTMMKNIIVAIGKKKRGLTRKEILDELKITDSGALSKFLNALIEGDFIFKYAPFDSDKRIEYYKLIDPFCIFYLRFFNDEKRIRKWSNVIDSQECVVFRGLAFENVCFNHIKQIKNALGISGVSTEESLWTKKEENEGTQIDLVIDRKDNIIDLCEVKFLNDEFAVTKDYHQVLMRRKNLVQNAVSKKKSVQNVLITTYGLKRNEYYWDFSNVITIDDLFKE